MTDFTLHVPGPDDWPLYRDLRLAALADSPDAFGSTHARESAFTEETWRARLAPGNTLIAESPDLGACGLAGVVPAPPGGAELVSVWVAPAARKQGLAEQLVDAALTRAAALGAAQLSLWVTADNPAAERLYLRLGFRHTDRIQPIRPGEPRLEVQLARPTTARATSPSLPE